MRKSDNSLPKNSPTTDDSHGLVYKHSVSNFLPMMTNWLELTEWAILETIIISPLTRPKQLSPILKTFNSNPEIVNFLY